MKTVNILLAVVVSAMVFSACQKKDFFQPDLEHTEIDKAINSSNDMLVFNTTDDFLKTYYHVKSLDRKAINAFESQNGFRSFGSICDSIYLSIDFESFKSQEELIEFIEHYSEFLQLVYNEDGDVFVETVLFNNPMRYFVNSDRLFQINDNIIKVFETKTLQTSIENIDVIKAIDNENIKLNIDDKIFNLLSDNHTILNTKDAAYNCGIWDEDREDNGRNRTYIRISVESIHLGGGSLIKITEQNTGYMVRPYHRTLGIWYWCRRTISCNLKVATGYYSYDSQQWIRVQGNYSNPGTLTTSLSGILSSQEISFGYWANPIAHFDGYNCWATTPSTGVVTLKCNEFIIQ